VHPVGAQAEHALEVVHERHGRVVAGLAAGDQLESLADQAQQLHLPVAALGPIERVAGRITLAPGRGCGRVDDIDESPRPIVLELPAGWPGSTGSIVLSLNRGYNPRGRKGLMATVEIPSAIPAEEMADMEEAALSTRILGLFYKAVSREVFVFSVVNRLLVRRLLRPALIAEQFCHVHLPSNLSEQADHFLRSQLPPSYPHVCSNVLRQRPILGRDFVREIVP